jgi:hypothetical protein
MFGWFYKSRECDDGPTADNNWLSVLRHDGDVCALRPRFFLWWGCKPAPAVLVFGWVDLSCGELDELCRHDRVLFAVSFGHCMCWRQRAGCRVHRGARGVLRRGQLESGREPLSSVRIVRRGGCPTRCLYVRARVGLAKHGVRQLRLDERLVCHVWRGLQLWWRCVAPGTVRVRSRFFECRGEWNGMRVRVLHTRVPRVHGRKCTANPLRLLSRPLQPRLWLRFYL